MLLFAHMGITLGAGVLARNAAVRGLTAREEAAQAKAFRLSPSQANPGADCLPDGGTTSFLTLVRDHFDYRFLLIGSVLPDLIDKPIGGVFFFETFQMDRILAHTLCFNLLLVALGVYLVVRCRRIWLLILSFGSVIHLILDKIWGTPQTFLWPAYGWSFPKLDRTDFFARLPQIPHAVTTNSSLYVPELVGLAILGWFVIRLIQTGQVRAFITRGAGP